jgi:hypothetical protein
VAALELRNKTYRVISRYGGRRYGFLLDTGDKQTAEALRGGVEKTLMLMGQGVLAVPEGADVVAFVRGGGKVTEPPKPASEAINLATLRDRYLQTHGNGAMENNSLATLCTLCLISCASNTTRTAQP